MQELYNYKDASNLACWGWGGSMKSFKGLQQAGFNVITICRPDDEHSKKFPQGKQEKGKVISK